MSNKTNRAIISQYTLGDMLIKFEKDTQSQVVGFYILPADKSSEDMCDKKLYRINSIAQAKLLGDMYPNCYANGNTLRNSQTADLFIYKSQTIEKEYDASFNVDKTIITTILEDGRNHTIENIITYYDGDYSFEVKNVFTNHSSDTATLELLSSFELGNITPLTEEDAHNQLILHRLRSKWSHEGRLVSEPVEDLQLEPSWANCTVAVERFGTVGSMPVRNFFPFVGIEDTKNNVLWGASLAVESSWQMEVYRADDGLHLSGGYADREFGHWMKNIEPDASFESATSIISCCVGDIDTLCHRLVESNRKHVNLAPKSEHSLPVIFNEYCTTWGNPSHDNIAGIVDTIKDKGFEYFVIDCGWFKVDDIPWDVSMGDYNISNVLFPNGLDKTVSLIKDNGMKAGIWFEIDNVGPRSKAYSNHIDHLLHKDGFPLNTSTRRFWDMKDPWVIDYLSDKVIGTLKKYSFDYMKMDYNETIGIGCDGAESLGEGLRQNMEASVNFIRKVKEEIPDIILENCSSGGHKLEPLMMRECSMASFSDAHETEEIPIIAANLHRAILPQQSQIWAVIRKDDSLKRIGYSVGNTFLGRMCISGDVTDLTDAQWDVIDRGIAFYKKCSYIIKDGFSHRIGPKILSDRHPDGWQCIKRVHPSGDTLLVIHTFNGDLADRIEIDISDCCTDNLSFFTYSDELKYEISDDTFVYYPTENMNAVVVLISK